MGLVKIEIRKVSLAIALCLAWPPAIAAQFIGYVGLQTVTTRVLNNSATVGRTIVNANIGASYHTFTYCLASTVNAIQLVIEESPDGQVSHFTQISPVSGFPGQTINGNPCGVIRVGGYYAQLAVNVLTLSGGTISVWYTATAGPTDIFPPAVNSNGGTSPVQCDQTFEVNSLPPGTITDLIPGNPFQSIYVCGGTVSFDGPTTTGFLALFMGAPSPSNPGGFCQPQARAHPPAAAKVLKSKVPAGGPHRVHPLIDPRIAQAELYTVIVTPATPQLFAINSAPNSVYKVPATTTGLAGLGANLCLNLDAITANTTITLSFAQF